MYLSKEIYVGAHYRHRNVTGSVEVKIGGKLIPIDFSKISEITERVGQWRKANHIHKWFVENIQSGIDDCGKHYVSEENLQKLLADCNMVLENQSVAAEVLPTQKGFFFGSTEYDEYYIKDIEDTIKIVEYCLANKDDGMFYYESSW